MADTDLKDHALNSSHDFYDLLGISVAAGESEVRRAYRKTALKYHPDKVGADREKLDKFHLLQIAYDVLTDSDARQLYDNARRAREEKKERQAAYGGRRKTQIEELERRESAGGAGLKRKREEFHAEEDFQSKLQEIAANTAQKRKEREELLRREAQEEYEREQNELHDGKAQAAHNHNIQGVEEIDRTISFRFPAGMNMESKEIMQRFSRFGKVQDVVLRAKKVKVEGEKHRREYTTAIIVFESIVGAHAAITDFPQLAEAERSDSDSDQNHQWTVFEKMNWASGHEPDCIPKPKERLSTPTSDPPQLSPAPPSKEKPPATPILERLKASGAGGGGGGGGLRKVPSFGSFKGTPKASSTPRKVGVGSPSTEELLMIRLKKNAERKRLEEQLRKEEAEGEAAEG